MTRLDMVGFPGSVVQSDTGRIVESAMVSPPVAGNALTVDRTTEPDTFFHIDDFQGLSPIYQPIQGNFYRLQTPDFIQTRKMLLLK